MILGVNEYNVRKVYVYVFFMNVKKVLDFKRLIISIDKWVYYFVW